MGGKAHGGERIPRERAIDLFGEVVRELSSFGTLHEGEIATAWLCGSARREKETCGDLDIVVIVHDKPRFEQFLERRFGMQKSGKKASRNGLIDGIQVEFYEATEANLGSFLQMWTGPWEHNVELRRKALRKGYSMSQYGFRHKGTGELIECASEPDVYHFLGLDYTQPSER